MAIATAVNTESPPPSVIAAGARGLSEREAQLPKAQLPLDGRRSGRGLDESEVEVGEILGVAEAAQALSEGGRSEIAQRAWHGLKRAHASLAKRVDAELERTHGLPLTSYEVLRHLGESAGGRMRMCDLADQAQLSRSGLTRLADRLEKEGLLERCSCEHDARGAYACLTELGRERLCAARATHIAVVREQFLSRFSEQELGTLAELWERIAPCGGGCRLG